MVTAAVASVRLVQVISRIRVHVGWRRVEGMYGALNGV